MRQWAEDHDRADDRRFGIIWKVFTVSAMAVVSLMAWSLKTNYDGMQAQLTELRATREQVQATGQQVISQVQRSQGQPPVPAQP